MERSSHVPPTHPRNDYQSLRWLTSFTQRVHEYSEKKKLLYCCTQHSSTAPTGSGHTLGPYPGPPRIDKLPRLRCSDERLELLVTFLLLCRTASDPSITAWLNPLSFGSKIDEPPKKCPSWAQPSSDFRDTTQPQAPPPALPSWARAAAMHSTEPVCLVL